MVAKRLRIILSQSTHKQNSDKQKIVIENVKANLTLRLTSQHPIRNKDSDHILLISVERFNDVFIYSKGYMWKIKQTWTIYLCKGVYYLFFSAKGYRMGI